jgi:hypothetical protein
MRRHDARRPKEIQSKSSVSAQRQGNTKPRRSAQQSQRRPARRLRPTGISRNIRRPHQTTATKLKVVLASNRPFSVRQLRLQAVPLLLAANDSVLKSCQPVGRACPSSLATRHAQRCRSIPGFFPQIGNSGLPSNTDPFSAPIPFLPSHKERMGFHQKNAYQA